MYANKGVQDVALQVGDPVYFKIHVRENTLSSRWLPYYRIIDQTSPVNFMIKKSIKRKDDKSTCRINSISSSGIGDSETGT